MGRAIRLETPRLSVSASNLVCVQAVMTEKHVPD
jgi:hypothetical protein